ncbi:MAG: hypothetical protein WA175_02655 [Candidatus Acidiferrales bacterium]
MRPLFRILPRLRVTIIAAFLAVTSSASFAQLPSQWNDAVRALAEKIAAAAASAHSLALNTTNTSSLSAADVSGISSALIAELARRHFTILSPASPSPGDAQVLLTLSEGAEGYVWVAQIRRGTENGEQVAIVAAPGPADSFPGAARKSLALSQKLIWRQPEKFLDFALLPADPSSSIRLVILDPEKLAFYAPGESQWQLQHVVRIPHSAPWPRDVTGEIDASAGKASLPGVNCEGDFARPETLQCVPVLQEKGSTTVADQEQLEIDGRAADFVGLGKVCDSFGPILLVTGTGDWTVPDELRAYEVPGGPPVAIGQAIDFPGPILAHSPADDGKSARVVSRNLQTGMYEASIVSVSCGD